MKRIVLVSSLLTTLLLADTNLGQKISVGTAEEQITYTENNPIASAPKVQNSPQLETRVSPKNVKRSFKKDHHRYHKRYSNFNYDRDGYYNDEGFYFGYYDTTGYFYNNIFFAYDGSYTYRDRRYRRGFFRRGHFHRRPYVHHTFNDWNRMRGYREPNVIVHGHYYDRRYYPRHSQPNVVHNHYYNTPPSRYNNPHHNHVRRDYHRPHSGHSRMHVTRMQENRANSRTHDRSHNHHFRDNHRSSRYHEHRPRNNHSRMHTHRGSSHGHKGGRHMGISR